MAEPAQHKNPLAERLRDRIANLGPISFRDWMECALFDERLGYYCRSDQARWGRHGDYLTSPQRSRLFGATFARKFSSLYEQMGRPPGLTILEAGAGSGDFAYDVLETLRRWFPFVFAVTHYIIDERSEDSRERIARKLADFGERVELRRIQDLARPITHGIIFSNELLDSFPVNLVIKQEGLLKELYVGLTEEGSFTWVEGDLTYRSASHVQKTDMVLQEGQITELNIEAGEWLETVAAFLLRGYVITVDYGREYKSTPHARAHVGRHEGLTAIPLNNVARRSLRAFYKHELVDDVLARPGEQDITTTVDWSYIVKAGEANGLKTISLQHQDRFLLEAGLLEQLELMTSVSTTDVDALFLRSSVRDLILPGGMSESFQVLIQESDILSSELR